MSDESDFAVLESIALTKYCSACGALPNEPCIGPEVGTHGARFLPDGGAAFKRQIDYLGELIERLKSEETQPRPSLWETIRGWFR